MTGDNFNIKSTGDSIRRLRKKRNLTQTELAKLIEKSLSTVQKYENDKISVPSSVTDKIAHVLKGQWCFFFNFNNEVSTSDAFFHAIIGNEEELSRNHKKHFYMLSHVNFNNEDSDDNAMNLNVGGLSPTLCDSDKEQQLKLLIQLTYALGYSVIRVADKEGKFKSVIIYPPKGEPKEVMSDDFNFYVNRTLEDIRHNIERVLQYGISPDKELIEKIEQIEE